MLLSTEMHLVFNHGHLEIETLASCRASAQDLEHLQSAHRRHCHTIVVPIILQGLNQKLQRTMSYWTQTNQLHNPVISQHALLLVLIWLTSGTAYM